MTQAQALARQEATLAAGLVPFAVHPVPDTRLDARAEEAQIVIVGGGLSGTLAAILLGRAGYAVTLIDRSAVFPEGFRAEKIAGESVDLMRRLGLLEPMGVHLTPYAEIWNVRRGKIIDRSYKPHFGVLYKDLVMAARAQIPDNVRLVVGRTVDVQTGPERQRIVLADGRTIEGRLVVLATGIGLGLCGIGRRVVRAKQSMSFGFDLEPGAGRTFGFPALTYYGEHGTDAIDYLSLFPIGATMRANLFTFHDIRDPWVRKVRQDPKEALLEAMPDINRYLGDFVVPGKVHSWVMDLAVAEGFRRDGVVVVGDAFQTSCPAAGVGIGRLLCDVDRLCNVHIPNWLDTSGMGIDKIGHFYDDPFKQRTDARAARSSAYRRSLALDRSLGWRMHRGQVYLRRRAIGWIKDLASLRPSEWGKDDCAHLSADPPVYTEKIESRNDDTFDVTTQNSFDFLSPEYRTFFERSAASAFQHPVWLKHFYATLATQPNVEPLIIVVRKRPGGELALVLPLVRRRYSVMRVIEFADLGVSDYASPVCTGSDFGSILASDFAREKIEEQLRPYDVLRVRKLQSKDLPLDELFSAARRSEMEVSAHCVALYGPYSKWRAATVDASLRKELDKKVRKLGRKGRVEFKCAQDPELINATLRSLREHRGIRFATEGTCLLQQDPYFDFYCAVSADKSFARTYCLLLDDKPIASVFGLAHGGRFLVVLSGFESSTYKSLSLGKLLFEWVAQDCIERGESALDFTIGDEAYKAMFGAEPSGLWMINGAGSAQGSIVSMVDQWSWLKKVGKRFVARPAMH